MKRTGISDSGPLSAPILPRRGAPKKHTVKWNGREIPLVQHEGLWRMRSRSSDFPVSFGTGTSDLAMARQRCRAFLDANPVTAGQTRGTLEEAASVYLAIPKKCSDETAAANISRLRSVVEKVTGGNLESVNVSALPSLWHEYVAKRQGREVADFSSRARINLAINSALRQASSIFRKKLHVHYRARGIFLPAEAGSFELLPTVRVTHGAVDDAALCAAWDALGAGDRDLWLAVGLARFAGLRLSEIMHCRGKWVVARAGGAVIELRDREEDGVRTKTGVQYVAMVLNKRLAEHLLALEPDQAVIRRTNVKHWLGTAPQTWLRPFTGAAKKPLHRCRGLYLDQIARETQDAILARKAGVQAAADAAGHTTTAVTERHYLSERE